MQFITSTSTLIQAVLRHIVYIVDRDRIETDMDKSNSLCIYSSYIFPSILHWIYIYLCVCMDVCNSLSLSLSRALSHMNRKSDKRLGSCFTGVNHTHPPGTSSNWYSFSLAKITLSTGDEIVIFTCERNFYIVKTYYVIIELTFQRNHK